MLIRTSIVAMALGCGLWAAPALAQNDAQRLAAENGRLRDQVAELEAKLQAALAEIDLLRIRLEDAEERLGNLEPPRPPQYAEVSADPFSSPYALFRELVRLYERELATLPRQTEAEDRAFGEAVERWVNEAPRRIRAEREWTVRIEAVERESTAPRKFTGLVSVIDPATGLAYGPGRRMPLPPRMAQDVLDGADRHDLWLARVTVAAAPARNADRESPGVFNEPWLIGPQVEFGFDLEWRELEGIEKSPVANVQGEGDGRSTGPRR
ncbi:MAG: hypothetical protein ACF8R7_14140 [Phycisphaerales bacterium JB039]